MTCNRICQCVSLVALLLGGAEAQAADKPRINLLFVMTDQHHYAACLAGNPVVKTPNLDRLASQGARLENAFCVTPYCSPTRAAIVTGQFPSSFGSGVNRHRPAPVSRRVRFHEPRETYLHHLAAQGYHCHQLGKWHLGGALPS